MFVTSVTVRLGDGASTKFWTDAWLPDGRIASFAPSFFQAIPKRRRHRTVLEALTNRTWVRERRNDGTSPVGLRPSLGKA
jgi:hypothetical protein